MFCFKHKLLSFVAFYFFVNASLIWSHFASRPDLRMFGYLKTRGTHWGGAWLFAVYGAYSEQCCSRVWIWSLLCVSSSRRDDDGGGCWGQSQRWLFVKSYGGRGWGSVQRDALQEEQTLSWRVNTSWDMPPHTETRDHPCVCVCVFVCVCVCVL